ncbi:MAG: exodeoxyribonuclease VII large subunit [Gemmatimonadota bacterium]|nr:exodeoxyribonuclease VII large subunit [Gemmatimonadota bacterium]
MHNPGFVHSLPDYGTLPSIAEVLARYDPAIAQPPLCWVQGEVSDTSTPDSGHIYFRISDGTSVPCLLWRTVSRARAAHPQDGLLVAVHGWVQRSPRDGRLEFDVRDLVRCNPEGDIYLHLVLGRRGAGK